MANLNEPTTQRPRSAEHDRARDESRSDRTTSGAPSQSYVEFRDDATERGSGATQQSHGRGTQTSKPCPPSIASALTCTAESPPAKPTTTGSRTVVACGGIGT